MAELKTKLTQASVDDFIDAIEDEQRRDDCRQVLNIMTEVTGEPPRMWGSSIVGFGTYTYTYATGRSGDWMLTGFSPRKQALTLYIMSCLDGYDELLNKLGKYKTGKSCLYVKKLSDIDEEILRKLIKLSTDDLKKKYS